MTLSTPRLQKLFLSRAPAFLLSILLVSGTRRTIDAADATAQPLAANAKRVATALRAMGHPLPDFAERALTEAAEALDSEKLQNVLDELSLFIVDINPELRVKVKRGAAKATLQQAGYTPFLVRINNQGTSSHRLNIGSPQAGPVYAGAALGILERQQQTELKKNENTNNTPGRFLDVQMHSAAPMTDHLSGADVEYAIALIYSSEPGKREATISFDIGQGTQDIGFRAEVPILFETRPAIPVRLSISDDDGKPTVASLTFRDSTGRIFPPQPKRLAPDLFFQPQIYRTDGASVLLPPGRFELTFGRGPEYREITKGVVIEENATSIDVKLQRWINPAEYGFYTGDHHIHAAGCSHYEIPTQGITPLDMFLQVKGEGLHVGCVLTWGPCYDFQRRFFSPVSADISEPFTILKYDLEISGFGSQALGHVCLLNLTNQTYPGSDGTKIKGWPTWTVPVMRWAKEQGGVTGYPHSDLFIDPPGYAKRLLDRRDTNRDSLLDRSELSSSIPLPKSFEQIDSDSDGRLSARELSEVADRAGNELPNLVLPSMRGSGAMEIFVSTAEGVCDFISAMNTGRIGEWNTWYHLLNCGFPLKVSGETDFPCMSSRRVGQGRVYVQLGTSTISKLNFTDWCNGLGQGRSYVSDGYAHALQFTVNGVAPGFRSVTLSRPGKVSVRARVAFAPETPKAVSYGTLDVETARFTGDTVLLHAPRNKERIIGGERLVEIIMNGEVAWRKHISADGSAHELSFEIDVKRSSWIALRQFPQLHTNPVDVLVEGKPIRASKNSALWCAESIELLWDNRSRFIAEPERPAARAAYDRALSVYRARAAEASN